MSEFDRKNFISEDNIMNFRKKMIAVVLVVVGLMAGKGNATLPDGWEVEKQGGIDVVTKFPHAPGKTYEELRKEGTCVTKLVFHRCLGIPGTLRIYAEKGMPVHFFGEEKDGTTVITRWIDPKYRAQTCKPNNDEVITFLIQTPSQWETKGEEAFKKTAAGLSKSEVLKMLDDQRLSEEQKSVLTPFLKNYSQLQIMNIYDLRQGDEGRQPWEYGFGYIANLKDVVK